MSSVLNIVGIEIYLNISIVGWDGKSNLYPTVISIIIFNAIMKAIKKTNIVPPVYIALFHLLTHCVYQTPLIHYTTMEWERVNINRIDIDLHHTAYDLETKFYCFWIIGGIRHKIGVCISEILVGFFLLCRANLFLFFIRIEDITDCMIYTSAVNFLFYLFCNVAGEVVNVEIHQIDKLGIICLCYYPDTSTKQYYYSRLMFLHFYVTTRLKAS